MCACRTTSRRRRKRSRPPAFPQSWPRACSRDTEPTMDVQRLAAGQVIDGFTLEQPLDPGGMASFWRVSRPGSDMPMLMKIPLMRRGEDPITIVGFEVEQMILARLTGPHVPRFVAAGDFERPYIVMEYVAGRSVRSLLDKLPLAPEEVAAIGARIAFALHDLHSQHVTH